MEEVVIDKNDELVMKLLHFFITEQGYNPIILHGAKNEIWLENLDSSYKIVRIVSNYIHNNEQLEYDVVRTRHITKKIKKKTLSMNMNVLNIFINLGDSADIEEYVHAEDMDSIDIKNIKDINKYDFILEQFPTITNKTNFREKGAELFMKITKDITKKNEENTIQAEDVFKMKNPIITYILIAINVILFILMYVLGKGSTDVLTLVSFGANFGELVKAGEWWRLLTGTFLHIGLIHLICNMYCLYVVGPQLESFFGKVKYLFIYLISGVIGSLFSVLFTDGVSAGASGAIFGLFGALLYFGYHYRVYLGTVIKSQIIPLIVLNLSLGFILSGIDNSAHIGGLIGGALASIAVGVKYKSSNFEKVNGMIVLTILLAFLGYMVWM